MGRPRRTEAEKAAGALNKFGQVLGPKGSRTRQRIIEATGALLSASGGSEPPLAEIAAAAAISAPTFYLYFEDVGEAVLAAVGQLGPRLAPVLALLAAPWPADRMADHAATFVQAYFDYWGRNAAELRVRNQRADQGDARFVALRLTSTEVLIQALARKLPNPAFPDGLPCPPEEAATVLVTALERLATTFILKLYPETTDDPGNMVRPLINLILLSVRGA